jgi:vacuolar-type H+-ATPase subunit F/Vma7
MERIVDILKKTGPLTGKDLLKNMNKDSLSVWRECNTSDYISTKTIGKRYLRLDRDLKGYARLSPSILREFLTYTIIGLNTDAEIIKSKAAELHACIDDISKKKFSLSKEIIARIVRSQKNSKEIFKKAVFLIAGDIVYNMAHKDPRPESSTNIVVSGSDLDIIIVTENLSKKIVEQLDSSIYKEKYRLLKMPAYREEIDYIIKDMAKVDKQANFDCFEHMVASKILNEGKFLFGSRYLFDNINKILSDKKIPEKLAVLEKNAVAARAKAVSYLLKGSGPLFKDEYKNLFYTTEEKEEIF